MPYVQKIREANYRQEVEREMIFKLRHDMLNKMIDEKLTDQESEKSLVSVDDEDVDLRIEQIKKEYFLTDEELKKSLAADGYTMEGYKKRIKEQMLRIKLINIEVKSKIAITGKEIRDHYENNKKDYGEILKYHLRTIVIRVPGSADADQKRAALEKMKLIVRKLEYGAAFDKLAREYSQDFTATGGGDLGLFTLDELSTGFKETVRWMSEGDTSPVLQTQQGYQIVKLQEIKKLPGKTLKDARIEIHDKLYKELVEEKYKTWFKELRDRSYVKIIQ